MNPALTSLTAASQLQSLIVVYMDKNNERRWDDIWGRDLPDWVAQHADCRISGIFLASADMVGQYERLHSNVGTCSNFHVGDRFYTPKGETVSFLGVNPSNRKYKCIIYNETAGKRFKVTQSYMQNLTKI